MSTLITNPPLRIGIDGQEANISNRVGSNVYAFEMINAIYMLISAQTNVHVTVFLTRQPLDDLPKTTAFWQYQIVTPRFFSTQWGLPLSLHAKKDHLDVFFTPGHYAPRHSPLPYVSTVMDLAFLHFPKYFTQKDRIQLTQWTKYSVKNANHIIAISDFTKKDIQTMYNTPARKITTVYPALPLSNPLEIQSVKEEQETQILKNLRVEKPYILYVGTLQPRKNIQMLVEGYEKLSFRLTTIAQKHQKKPIKKTKTAQASPIQLVLAGKHGWMSRQIIKRIQASPLRQHIIVTGYISELQKRILYKHAVCSTLVGLYEGFGIPVLESLQNKTVPVISKNSSLPEVGGSAAIYVNPEDSLSIAKGLEQACCLTVREKRQFEKAARAQLKKFSWSSSAQTVIQILEKVGRKRS